MDLIDRWRSEYQIKDLDPDEIAGIADEVEVALDVGKVPGRKTPGSEILRRGAAALGWRHSEIPRWMSYPPGGDAVTGKRQSMTRTYLPRAFAAGARMMVECRVDRMTMVDGAVSSVTVRSADGSRHTIRCKHAVVCGGAIQTPALLQRSGLRARIGRSLAVHPTVKLSARFSDAVNVPDDVPVHQVKEFAPDLSFGGSASHPGLVALALSDSWNDFSGAITQWQQICIYYAAITSEGRGVVQAIPGLRDPLVTYRLTRRDRETLRSCLLYTSPSPRDS